MCSLLRDYLEMEFKSAMGVPWFDVERVVDDFVLFCMLIGNDFLPGAGPNTSSHPHKFLLRGIP
jgi:5'-3' exonuclease